MADSIILFGPSRISYKIVHSFYAIRLKKFSKTSIFQKDIVRAQVRRYHSGLMALSHTAE